MTSDLSYIVQTQNNSLLILSQLNAGPHYIELESPISELECGIQLEIGHNYVFNGIIFILQWNTINV